MKVQKRIRDRWKLLKQGGDVSYIAGALGVSIKTVSRAMNGGECTEDTFTAIRDFYRKRSENLQQA